MRSYLTFKPAFYVFALMQLSTKEHIVVYMNLQVGLLDLHFPLVCLVSPPLPYDLVERTHQGSLSKHH